MTKFAEWGNYAINLRGKAAAGELDMEEYQKLMKNPELSGLSHYQERALRHQGGCPNADSGCEECQLCELNMLFNQQSM